jgi:hypothetical protein
MLEGFAFSLSIAMTLVDDVFARRTLRDTRLAEAGLGV